MQAVIGGVSLGTPLIKMAMNLLGLGPLVNLFPMAEYALKAATVLFGVTSGSVPTILLNMVSGYAATMAVSGLTVLVLGTGGAVGFAASALLFIVKTTAGLVYLTVDLTARGIAGAGKALWEAMPRSTPPPAHWHIQDNYKPANRSSHLPPPPTSLGDSQPVFINPKEISKLTGDDSISSSFIECSNEQLDLILGRSRVKAPNASIVAPTPSYSPSHSPSFSKAPEASSSAPSTSNNADLPNSQVYPVATVSQDAFAGYLGQSIRQIQLAKQQHANKFTTIEEVEEAILNDPEFKAPKDSEPGYSAKKLEQSVDLHASKLRQRDPVVDSWFDVSAPMMGE